MWSRFDTRSRLCNPKFLLAPSRRSLRWIQLSMPCMGYRCRTRRRSPSCCRWTRSSCKHRAQTRRDKIRLSRSLTRAAYFIYYIIVNCFFFPVIGGLNRNWAHVSINFETQTLHAFSKGLRLARSQVGSTSRQLQRNRAIYAGELKEAEDWD